MSALLWLPVGILPSTVIGWLALRLVEGNTPVLLRGERWILGFVIGLMGSMYVTFILHLTLGVRFTLLGFGLVQSLLLIALLIAVRGRPLPPRIDLPESGTRLSRWATIAVGMLTLWTAVKIVALTANLLATPTVLDDTIDNWNLRAKLFFHDKALTLVLPFEEAAGGPTGISAYPPAVPMIKTFLVTLAGRWSEPLANSIHVAWFAALLLLFYWSLRRELPRLWSLLGVYLFTSIPLTILHGTNPYTELFMSLYVFGAVSMAFHALRASDPATRLSFFRVSALVAALFPFTKNEGLVMHLPILLLLVVSALAYLWRAGRMEKRDVLRTILWYAIPLLIVAVPWTAFKWMNGLTFGNAKAISGLTLSWQPDTLQAIVVMTFMEGNWLLLFPLLLGLCALQFRTLVRSALLLPLLYVAIVFVGQLFLFLFTALSIEARMQTGYGRGIVQLLPVIVFIATVLLSWTWNRWQKE